jgi:hypothetical protein
MTAIEIAIVTFGAVVVIGDSIFALFPVQMLRWYREAINTDKRIRILSAVSIALGVLCTWIGTTEQSTAAYAVLVLGLLTVCTGSLMMVGPSVYRELIDWMMPSEPGPALNLWRVMSVGGIGFGVFLIYFGMLVL